MKKDPGMKWSALPVRKIILHYHLFKNAGSSVDRLLRETYQEQWRNFDGPGPGHKLSAADIHSYITANPELKAVSSHQVVPPVPAGDLAVFPMVFIREPLDRVRSAWLFEWQKQPKLEKPKGPLRDYVQEKLGKGKGSVIANFQVLRLSNQAYNETRPAGNIHEVEKLQHAMTFISSIPFFGLVDRFEESLQLLKKSTEKDFPELECTVYRENVSQRASVPLRQKYNRLRRDLGDELFGELLQRNRLDLQLYSYACGVFNERIKLLALSSKIGPDGFGMDNARSEGPGLSGNSNEGDGPSIAA